MKLLFTYMATFFLCLTAVSKGQAKILECSYDYITHLTTHTIEEGLSSTDLTVSYEHTVSSSGGEEMYLFKDTEEAALTGSATLHHIHGKLFQAEDFPSIQVIDFEQAQLIEVQFLEHQMMNNTPVEYLHWDCRRLD